MAANFPSFGSHSARKDFDFSFAPKSDPNALGSSNSFGMQDIRLSSGVSSKATPPNPRTTKTFESPAEAMNFADALNTSFGNLDISKSENMARVMKEGVSHNNSQGGMTAAPQAPPAHSKSVSATALKGKAYPGQEKRVKTNGAKLESSYESNGTDGSESSGDEGSEDSETSFLDAHLRLLEHRADVHEINEVMTTPIFTNVVRKYASTIVLPGEEGPFTQYGLLAGDIGPRNETTGDPRVFYNVAAPSSVFICGSQGSGKSHTLACLLENCLVETVANELPRPLSGIVFHYDTFISDSGGSPCELAYLSTNPDIRVRVLCAPTNIATVKNMYSCFPNIKVRELRLSQTDLNTKRMLDLMAVNSNTTMPLYLHVANRILREMRILQQRSGTGFDYAAFKANLLAEELTKEQLAPLKQRLDTLESFMVEEHAKAYNIFGDNQPRPQKKSTASTRKSKGTVWTPVPGMLTIVDLSCPCVTSDMACSLFNICLSLFLEQDSDIGRVIALDEAHKYMLKDSAECQTLTEALLATIRLQRHLGARIFISTQEPTISPKLLDLCSITIVHRFTSPDWLNTLKKHLAGVSSTSKLLEQAQKLNDSSEEGGQYEGLRALALSSDNPALELFAKIVGLRTGEALLFAPSAIIAVQKSKAQGLGKGRDSVVKHLAHGVLKVCVRNRITTDGGRSIMAS